MKALLLAALVCIGPPLARAADTASITKDELVRRTQSLYDALVPGDQAPWKRFYADDAMIFDEKGRDMDKAALVADVQPMPKGYSGEIKLNNIKVRFAPNVAILSYDAIETETIFGRELHARYHSTDTWLYRSQLWQIISSQTLRYYEDPATGNLNAALLPDYVGTYELAPGNRLTITREGDRLFAQRGTAKPVELFPESTDMFFRAGVEGRRLFHRDATGKVDVLIDRRNNEDLLWKKIS